MMALMLGSALFSQGYGKRIDYKADLTPKGLTYEEAVDSYELDHSTKNLIENLKAIAKKNPLKRAVIKGIVEGYFDVKISGRGAVKKVKYLRNFSL